jgi:NTP pyrophosphatase (non-canonical NTP hydrolase)
MTDEGPSMTTPDCDPTAAALHYIALAMMQRARPDANVIDILCGQPPDLLGGYHWPYGWDWDPAATWSENLMRARLLLDTELAEPGAIVYTGCYPSQTEISEWSIRNEFNNTLEIQALQLAEEVGEIARAIVKRHQGIRGTFDEWTSKLRDELGDAFISLVNLADIAGFDLMTVAVLRWQTISKRDFRADPQGLGLPESDVA